MADTIIELKMWLFDTSNFVTRSHCGDWPNWLTYTYQASNLIIAIAYFIIPVILLYLYYKKKNIFQFPYILILFSSFILLCGWTHLNEIFVFWWAPYYFYTLIDSLTALISIITAFYLPYILRQLLKLKTSKDYEDLIVERNEEIFRRAISVKKAEERTVILEEEVKKMKENVRVIAYYPDIEDQVVELRNSLKRIQNAK